MHGKEVALYIDNKNVSYILESGSNVCGVHEICLSIHDWCSKNDVCLSASYHGFLESRMCMLTI